MWDMQSSKTAAEQQAGEFCTCVLHECSKSKQLKTPQNYVVFRASQLHVAAGNE
jgi:hypothetical protein